MSSENVKKLKEIIEKVNESNINIQQLPAVENRSMSLNLSLYRCFLFISIILGFITIIYAKIWRIGEKCLIAIPDSFSHAFRPPEDCSFCRNVTHADRVSNISPREFEQFYAYNARPVVVTDATHDWSALDVFDFWYFKDVYDLSDSDQMNCQFFPVN